MKRCPTCNRTFDDEVLTVCPDDGSGLTGERQTRTQGFDALGGKGTWNPSQEQIAEIKDAVGEVTKPQRRVWLWFVIAVIVLIILIGLGVIIAGRL
jgi:hypothetical protein